LRLSAEKVAGLGIGLLERSFLNLQMLLQINLQKAARFKNIKVNGVDHY